MYKICSALGLPSEEMIEKSRKSRRHFFEKNPHSSEPPYVLRPCRSLTNYTPRTLSEIIGVNTGGPGGSRKGQPGHSKWDYLMFLQLVESCLNYDPLERITPLEALHSGFFHSYRETGGSGFM
jgi:dual specificity tyrosine-phosphorylation-regulated kinase 1